MESDNFHLGILQNITDNNGELVDIKTEYDIREKMDIYLGINQDYLKHNGSHLFFEDTYLETHHYEAKKVL